MTINRRDFLGAGLAAGASVLSGRCDDLEMRPDFRLVGKKWAGWSKGHFQIHSIYTGVGESLYLIFPDGTSALVDCGDWPAVKRGKLAVPVLPNSDTHAGEWIARYIERVNPIQPEVGYMIVSHFHSDHTGIESWAKPKPPDFPDNGGCARSGFALVAEKVKFRRAIDRGWPDYNQPLVIDKDGAEELAHMKKVYAWLQKRDGLHIERIRLGATDQIVPLHDRKSYPDFEVKTQGAEGLDNCRQMLKDAVKGKYPGYLLEGMACPGGCIAGPGTLQPINKSRAQVRAYAKRSPHKVAVENEFRSLLKDLKREGDDA